MKYGNVDLGQVEAMINKLGGEEGMKKFLSGKVTTLPTLQVKHLTPGVGGIKEQDKFIIREVMDDKVVLELSCKNTTFFGEGYDFIQSLRWMLIGAYRAESSKEDLKMEPSYDFRPEILLNYIKERVRNVETLELELWVTVVQI